MQVNPIQAKSVIQTTLKSKLVPLLVGSPGIGKSQIYEQVAKEYNLLLIDVRLSQADITDLCGFPTITGNKADYIPMSTFPLKGDPIPNGYSGWMLLFDELTSANPSLQAASYKIILDRKVGQQDLHNNVAICAAGNLETDAAIVHEMSTALQSRLIHFELTVNHKEWCDWAMQNDINHYITDFIKFKPSNLYTFKPDHTDRTYACPRTWEFANRILKEMSTGSTDLVPLLSGTLSEGVAREFISFMKIYTTLPKIIDIQTSPSSVPVPDEPSILFALTGSISHNTRPDNAEQLMIYVSRLPIEFQVVTLRETIRRNKDMLSHPSIQKWITKSSATLF